MTAPAAPVLPARYQVTGRLMETYDTVTLMLRPADPPITAPRPGQFTMLYSFGVGEIPVSVSGIGQDGVLVQTIREVGAVSRALCAAMPGEVIGVRGPFGTHWGVDAARGGDVLVVAGRAPAGRRRPRCCWLRAAGRVQARFGRVVPPAGARRRRSSPVSSAPGPGAGPTCGSRWTTAIPGWDGWSASATGLIPGAVTDPAATTAFVCGPEIMMRLSARALADAGVAAADIRVSLERNMRCGVARCGHCQLGPLLLCRDGPVVSYPVAAPLLAVREL